MFGMGIAEQNNLRFPLFRLLAAKEASPTQGFLCYFFRLAIVIFFADVFMEFTLPNVTFEVFGKTAFKSIICETGETYKRKGSHADEQECKNARSALKELPLRSEGLLDVFPADHREGDRGDAQEYHQSICRFTECLYARECKQRLMP